MVGGSAAAYRPARDANAVAAERRSVGRPSGAASVTAGIEGTLEGGYITSDIVGTFDPTRPTRGNLGTFDVTGTPVASWMDYFSTVTSSDAFAEWGWIYHAGQHGTWLNQDDVAPADSGDITS